MAEPRGGNGCQLPKKPRLSAQGCLGSLSGKHPEAVDGQRLMAASERRTITSSVMALHTRGTMSPLARLADTLCSASAIKMLNACH